MRVVRRGTKHGRRIGGGGRKCAICRGLPSGAPVQISIEFHWSIEMMKANDMLLWTVLRHRVRVLPHIGEFRPKIEEFHLTAAEPAPAQQGRRGDELARRGFRTVVERHL